MAKLRAEAEKCRQEAQEELARRTSELSMWDKHVTNQITELKKRTEELGTRVANTMFQGRQFTCTRQELGKRVQEVQNVLIKESRRSPSVRCAVEEERL